MSSKMDAHHYLGDKNGKESRITSDHGSPPQKLNMRREIELRKAKEKEEEKANYTFKPHIIHKSKQPDPPNTPRENRFDKLYSDALKRHITTHLREDQRDRGHSFAPKITSRSGSRSRTRDVSADRSTASVSTRGLSGERSTRALVERLTTPRRPKKEVAVEDPSFTPTISKRAQAIETLGSQEVAKRLYEHSKMMQEKLELKRNESEQKARDACPFSPNLATRRSSSAQRARVSSSSIASIIDRSQRFEEEKQLRLEEARKQKAAEELAEVTFKPQLVATKRPTTPSNRLPVYERLAVPLDKSVSPQVALAYADYTFHPKLLSKRGPSPSRYSAEYSNIHDRLFHEGLARQQELQEERANLRQTMEAELTFKPQINVTSSSSKETAQVPVFQRLAASVSSPEKTQRIQAELKKDWTFSPALSSGTLRIANTTSMGSSSVFERLAEEERIMREENERRLREKKEKEEEEFRKLTFSPALPTKSIQLFSRSSDGSDVYTRLNHGRMTSKSSSNSMLDLASVYHDSVAAHEAKRIVKDEEELKSLFERLSMTQVRHIEPEIAVSPELTPKKVVLPKENVDAIVDRLANQHTKSFILKHDSEESEQIIKQHSTLKEVPKIRAGDLDSVVERLRGHTLSTAASLDLKAISRSVSIDANASVISNLTPNTFNLPSPTSVLQQTLARRMTRADRTFVETLEASDDATFQSIPRNLSRDPSPFFSQPMPALGEQHEDTMSVAGSLASTSSRALAARQMVEEVHEHAEEEKRRTQQRRYSFSKSNGPTDAAHYLHADNGSDQHTQSQQSLHSFEHSPCRSSLSLSPAPSTSSSRENLFLRDPSAVRQDVQRESKSPSLSRGNSTSSFKDQSRRDRSPPRPAAVDAQSHSAEDTHDALLVTDLVFEAQPTTHLPPLPPPTHREEARIELAQIEMREEMSNEQPQFEEQQEQQEEQEYQQIEPKPESEPEPEPEREEHFATERFDEDQYLEDVVAHQSEPVEDEEKAREEDMDMYLRDVPEHRDDVVHDEDAFEGSQQGGATPAAFVEDELPQEEAHVEEHFEEPREHAEELVCHQNDNTLNTTQDSQHMLREGEEEELLILSPSSSDNQVNNNELQDDIFTEIHDRDRQGYVDEGDALSFEQEPHLVEEMSKLHMRPGFVPSTESAGFPDRIASVSIDQEDDF